MSFCRPCLTKYPPTVARKMSFPIPCTLVGHPWSRKGKRRELESPAMSEFSLAELLESRRGEDLDLWARTINPQFARVR